MKRNSAKRTARRWASWRPLEKQCLIWLARRTPPWIDSDHLSALGLVSLLGAGLNDWYAHWHRRGMAMAIACLCLNWLGDSLDGTLARVRNRLRPQYEFYVDHVVDAFGTFFLLGGLGLSGYMSQGVATGLPIAYFMLTIEVYLATYTMGASNSPSGISAPSNCAFCRRSATCRCSGGRGFGCWAARTGC